MTPRPPVLAGNWKLHHGPTATAAFFERFLPLLPLELRGTVALFPPTLSLASARSAVSRRPDIQLGVQNLYWEARGAFTGEISAPLAADAGATLALVGHSERRHLFGETDVETSRKTRAALAAGLSVVLCVGEKLDEREAGAEFDIVERQLAAVLEGGEPIDGERLLIAYEPVWAIGTGRNASPEDASRMHERVRSYLRERIGNGDVPVLYGGSVKADNAAELLAADHVDGLLIGGASLDAVGFARICELAA